MADFAPEASTTTSAPSPECSWTAAGRSVSVGSTARSAPRSRASSRFFRDRVGDDDVRGTDGAGDFQHDEPDGTGAGDTDRVAGTDIAPAAGVDADAERFAQRPSRSETFSGNL